MNHARAIKRALVLFSGGQDSVTCLYWALARFEQVYAISFDYGQRHCIELKCAQELCAEESIPWTLVDLSFLNNLNANALTQESEAIVKEGTYKNLPSTFVPGRNILFLSVAASWALPRGISDIVIGACETDYSGYPDCRDAFMRKMEASLGAGLDAELKIHTPLMFLTKGQTFQLAQKLGQLKNVIEKSHTCYRGDRENFNEWGYGCGECPACELRKKGFEDFKNLERLSVYG